MPYAKDKNLIMNIDELETRILNLFENEATSLSLEEIMSKLALPSSYDQTCLEIIWQNIGIHKLTLTRDRKFRKMLKEN